MDYTLSIVIPFENLPSVTVVAAAKRSETKRVFFVRSIFRWRQFELEWLYGFGYSEVMGRWEPVFYFPLRNAWTLPGRSRKSQGRFHWLCPRAEV